jgi:hypothetical protein
LVPTLFSVFVLTGALDNEEVEGGDVVIEDEGEGVGVCGCAGVVVVVVIVTSFSRGLFKAENPMTKLFRAFVL